MKRRILLFSLFCAAIATFAMTHFYGSFIPVFKRLSPGKYVWSMGFAYDCDITLSKSNAKHPRHYLKAKQIRKGDTLWLQARHVSTFYHKFLPKIKQPIILIITDGDEAFPSSYADCFDPEELIQSEKIIHIFAQNCDYCGPTRHKVSALPIGIDLHSLAQKGGYFGEQESLCSQEQEKILEEIITHLKPTQLREKKALVDFHLFDSIRHGNRKQYLLLGEDRTSIFHTILSSGVIIPLEESIPRRDLWRKKGEYAFSIAPQGNGMDTHRLWEDLILGCIVITKSSPLDPLYEGLPVVIIQDWSEIQEENLVLWLAQYGDAFTNPKYRERLTHAYWRNKIKQFKKN